MNENPNEMREDELVCQLKIHIYQIQLKTEACYIIKRLAFWTNFY